MSNDIYCLRDKVFMVKIHLGEMIHEDNATHTGWRTRRGDLYRCKTCGFEVLGDFGEWRSTNPSDSTFLGGARK